MKKLTALIAALLALSLWGTGAMAVTREQAGELAAQEVEADAQIMGIEQDDGLYEVRLSDTGAAYEVDVRESDGAVIEIERRVTGAPRAAAFEIVENQAAEATLALHPDATIDYVQMDRDDGACVYEVFYTAEGERGSVSVNAQTAEVVETKSWPEAARLGILSAGEAVSKAMARQTGEITEMELGYGRRGYEYDGEILSGRTEISFELDAQTGDFIEWELDD